MDDQDWNTVVFKKSATQKAKESKSRVPEGMKLERKYGGTNKQRPTEHRASKIEAAADAEESPSRKEVNPELKNEVVKARTARKWKQKDLATAASIQLKAVQAIESGKMPAQADFQRIVRALGLRGIKKTK